jgi:hypothetical protein
MPLGEGIFLSLSSDDDKGILTPGLTLTVNTPLQTHTAQESSLTGLKTKMKVVKGQDTDLPSGEQPPPFQRRVA